jgi:hypothetical protein
MKSLTKNQIKKGIKAITNTYRVSPNYVVSKEELFEEIISLEKKYKRGGLDDIGHLLFAKFENLGLTDENIKLEF